MPDACRRPIQGVRTEAGPLPPLRPKPSAARGCSGADQALSRAQQQHSRVAQGASRPAADLLADLADARRAERLVASLLAQVRDELADTVLHARSMRIGYDRMAQHTLRAVHRSTVTLFERRREAVRLRKLVHRRRRVTAGHGYPSAAHGTSPVAASPSIATGGKAMAQKLISRKTIEERFVDSDEDERVDDTDELEGEDERNEDEPEPRRVARPRR